MNDLLEGFVRIDKGSIRLRDDRKGTNWAVELAPFRILATPVTQAHYSNAMGENPSLVTGADLPVETVSWLDAVQFCNQLSMEEGYEPFYVIDRDAFTASHNSNARGYRLPSEAEWEFACRAGSHTPRYGDLDDIAWYAENSGGSAQPVGTKRPNGFGLFDLLGNVWEWCDDLYDAEVYGPYRVFRGGGWSDAARGVLATNRRRSHPTFAIDDLGFRVAISEPD